MMRERHALQPDGTIWGGEILICEGAGFERFSHLRDIPMIGGDSSMRDGWKSAVCRAADHERNKSSGEYTEDDSLCSRNPFTVSPSGQLCDKATELGMGSTFDIDISYAVKYAHENGTLSEYEAERKIVEAAVARGVNTVRTSSMGRLFDAVASLLGICHVNRYEGECAVMLENAADRALRLPGVADAIDSANAINAVVAIDIADAAKAANIADASDSEVAIAFSEGKASVGGVKFRDAADALALRFHLDAARAVLGECRKARDEHGTDTVCLSGGVFQNKILMERTLRLLRADGFTPYYNISVPPNDGGIALGQAYIAMWAL
jgi:hydrogenase maturation protein HypF